MAPKFTILCILTVIGIVISVMNFFLGIAYQKGSLSAVLGLLLCAVIAFVNCLVYGIVLCTMKGQDSRFMAAGVSYIIFQALYTSGSGLFSDRWFGMIFELAGIVLGLVFIFSFVSAVSEVLSGVDDRLAKSWDTFKKFIAGILIGILACILMMFVLILSALGALGLMILGIALIGMFIWQIVLLFMTAGAMRNFRS